MWSQNDLLSWEHIGGPLGVPLASRMAVKKIHGIAHGLFAFFFDPSGVFLNAVFDFLGTAWHCAWSGRDVLSAALEDVWHCAWIFCHAEDGA